MASMESVDMGARDTNIGPGSNRGFCTTWDFHLYNKASLLFSTLPRQTFSYTSASILDKLDRQPSLANTTSEIMGHGKRVQYYMGSAFFTITVRGVDLSIVHQAGVQFG